MSALNIFRLLGDLFHLVSIFFLAQKIFQSRSCAGISLKSQLLYMAVYATRYLDLFSQHKPGFLRIYNGLMKVVFLVSQSVVLYFMMNKYRSTVDPRMDSFKNVLLVLVLPCVILSFVFIDRRVNCTFFEYVREWFWTFSILLESVAILPQLFQLQKTGEAESITTHYLLCLGLYRMLYLINWIYRWLFGEGVEGIAVFAGLIQTALYSDLFWVYYNRVFKGKMFKLPI